MMDAKEAKSLITPEEATFLAQVADGIAARRELNNIRADLINNFGSLSPDIKTRLEATASTHEMVLKLFIASTNLIDKLQRELDAGPTA